MTFCISSFYIIVKCRNAKKSTSFSYSKSNVLLKYDLDGFTDALCHDSVPVYLAN